MRRPRPPELRYPVPHPKSAAFSPQSSLQHSRSRGASDQSTRELSYPIDHVLPTEKLACTKLSTTPHCKPAVISTRVHRTLSPPIRAGQLSSEPTLDSDDPATHICCTGPCPNSTELRQLTDTMSLGAEGPPRRQCCLQDRHGHSRTNLLG